MVHQHSRSHKARRREEYASKKKKRSDRIDPLTPHGVLLNQSWKDPINGEIVHTQMTEKVVYATIKLLFGDGYELICTKLEYGQVLNRFPLAIPSEKVDWREVPLLGK